MPIANEGKRLAFTPSKSSQETPQKQAAAKGSASVPPGRVASGIPGLDSLLGGGFEEASTTLIMGGPGCGKTTFLAQFLYRGASEFGEAGVLLSFEEEQSSIRQHMASFGIDFDALEKQGMFSQISYRPHEVKKLVDEGGGLIHDTVSSLGAKRLAIDSLTSYTLLFDTPYKAREAEIAFFELLRKWKCTTLLSAEGMPSDKDRATGGIEYLSDGVIVMHHPRVPGGRYRALEILKMRGSKFVEKLCPFEFVEGIGIQVHPDAEIFYDVKEL
jgi:KaiC/GvpD/RAD55 family RecA-like ATPase